MNSPGATNPRSSGDLLTQSRAALLDALEALAEHRDAVVVIGAQAIYIRTPVAPVALAEATKDSDLAMDPRILGENPLVEDAMTAAGFMLNPDSGKPGAWITPLGIPVDLMVPGALAGPGSASARGARLPPHDKRSMRRARGLEAVVVDNSVETVGSLEPADVRAYAVKVAGPAALVVAKIHKIAERLDQPRRLQDKDAHDIYRVFRGVETAVLVAGFRRLLIDSVSQSATEEALAHIATLLASGPDAEASVMAGRAEEGIGEPATVSLALSILAQDLLNALSLPNQGAGPVQD